jgi:hypothetical protein
VGKAEAVGLASLLVEAEGLVDGDILGEAVGVSEPLAVAVALSTGLGEVKSGLQPANASARAAVVIASTGPLRRVSWFVRLIVGDSPPYFGFVPRSFSIEYYLCLYACCLKYRLYL